MQNTSSNSDKSDDDKAWNAWKNILFLLKIGFSLSDIRHMSMSDFIAYTDLYMSDITDDSVDENGDRIATQADIDALFM